MRKFCLLSFLVVFASSVFAREETVLARVTGYWAHGSGGSGGIAASNGALLHVGHCAVDPKRIPYGSKVVFPDTICAAVDTGPAVVNRKSARSCGRTAAQKNAIVIDRFFESKRDAVTWSNAHPEFMTLKILSPGSAADASSLDKNECQTAVSLPLPNLCATSEPAATAGTLGMVKPLFSWR